MIKINILLFALAVVPGILVAQDQITTKTGIKAGFDVVSYFSSQSNSFTKETEQTFSIFTGLSSASNSSSTVVLEMELNYVKSICYKNNQLVAYDDRAALVHYNGVFDEQFNYEFVELCFPVEIFPAVLNNDVTVGFYLGPSIGFGSTNEGVKETSRTFVDSLKHFNYFLDYQEPTGYPGGSDYCFPMSLNFGMDFIYRFVLIDLRYKTTFNISPSTNNLFLQLGVAF